MTDFHANVAKWAKKTKKDIDQSIRGIELQLFTSIIMSSPVGNPELWKVNQRGMSLRGTYKTFAAHFNEQGDGKRISVSKRALDKKFGKLKAPAGYTGGRFRANWNASIGQPDMTTTEAKDKTGAATVARMKRHIGGAGKVTYLANNLPYA